MELGGELYTFIFLLHGSRPSEPHLLDDDFPVFVHGAVVDHAHDGHAQVTADPEGDAEAEAAHHRDDVAAGQPEARAVDQRGLPVRGLLGPPILSQLDDFSGFLFLLEHSTHEEGSDNTVVFFQKAESQYNSLKLDSYVLKKDKASLNRLNTLFTIICKSSVGYCINYCVKYLTNVCRENAIR